MQDNKKSEELPDWVKHCAELSLGITLEENQIRDRAFHLVGGSVMFGICLSELPDSFLVGLPAVLVGDNGTVEGREFSASNIIRVMRSAVVYINIPENPYKTYYYKFLIKNFDELKDFFVQDRRDTVTNFVHNYENRSEDPDVEGFEEIDIIDHESAGASPEAFWTIHPSTGIH